VESNRTYIQQSPVIVALATAHPIHIFSYLFLPNSTQEVEYCMIDDLKFVGGNILAHATRYTFFVSIIQPKRSSIARSMDLKFVGGNILAHAIDNDTQFESTT